MLSGWQPQHLLLEVEPHLLLPVVQGWLLLLGACRALP
jgi:hypothetical protein